MLCFQIVSRVHIFLLSFPASSIACLTIFLHSSNLPAAAWSILIITSRTYGTKGVVQIELQPVQEIVYLQEPRDILKPE